MLKEVRIFILIFCLIFFIGCSNNNVKTEKNLKDFMIGYNSKILVYKEDVIDDDNGPGNYLYPTKEVFKKGDFDILSFMITETVDTYDFYIMIKNNFGNEWQMP